MVLKRTENQGNSIDENHVGKLALKHFTTGSKLNQ